MAGAEPSFSEGHVARLLILLSKGETGRKKLVRILEIGEGSVRTILKRLRGDGFIKSSKRGQLLSEKGKSYIQRSLMEFSAPMEFKPTETDKFGSMIIVHGRADKIKTGFEQRDIAVGAGSESVLILKYRNEELGFPTSDVRLSDFPDLIEGLKELKFKENDVVVISFAKTYAKAEDGAIAVALELIK